MKKRYGFTLAEVLITLGIIGIVSAMTIPTLMTNYQTKVWESKLKKSFSIATNACERMLVEENVSRASETRLYTGNNFEVRDYFKVMRGTPADGLVFPDSTVMTITNAGSGFHIYVDLTGEEGPNIDGRDRFAFNIDRNCAYVAYAAPEGDNPAPADAVASQRFDEVVDNNWKIKEVDEYEAGNEEEPPAP